MPQLTIGSKKYHLAFRIMVRCQLRTMDASHSVLAQGESMCLPGDVFDEKEGKRRAFSAMVLNMRKSGIQEAVVNDKLGRRKIWGDFLFWLSGKKKPQYKMKKKPIKLGTPHEGHPETHGLVPPFASGNPAGLSTTRRTGGGGD
jgi:hypothetical protein